MKLDEYTVLYVDDDEANRIVMKHTLGPRFDLRIADSAAEARRVMASEDIAVLLTDQRMPYETGVDLAEKTHRMYPHIVRVIITAYSDIDATIDAINRGRVNRFIKKPWTREEVIAVVEESILSYNDAKRMRALEERLVKQDRMAVVGVFSSSIAHDLRQPCAIIVPAVSILERDITTLERVMEEGDDGVDVPKTLARVYRTVENLTGATDRLQLITDSLLTYLSNRQTGLEPVEVGETVSGVVELFKSAVTKRARLKLDLGEEDHWVMGSPGRLIQLVSNLLLNASQAIQPGNIQRNSIEIGVSGSPETVTMAVADTGCGVPDDIRDKIFEPLFSTKGDEGSGLGLAICKQVVGEMRGRIMMARPSARGTTFIVTLPRVAAPEGGKAMR